MYDYEIPRPIEHATIEADNFHPIAEQLTSKLAASNRQIEPGVAQNDLTEVSDIFFDKVIPSVLHDKRKTFSLSLTVDNTEYLVPSKMDTAIVDTEETDEQVREADTIPTLTIKNPERFLVKVLEFQKVFKLKEYRMDWLRLSVPGHRLPEIKQLDFEDFMENIWWNATATDFANPEQYLEHVKDAMTDRSFEYYEGARTLGELPSLQNRQKY